MSDDLRLGRMIADRYRLDRVLGRGGMGAVYGGIHTWTERPVAVKVLHPTLAEHGDLRKRFVQEAKVTAGLRHPNVVDVLDMGEDDEGTAFIVFELLEGEPLSSRLARATRKLEPLEALRVLVPVMDALRVAHTRNIIHRDLKPDNVFLARAHGGAVTPKLLDFGIAKLLDDARVRTITGSLLGTPSYMSPEQIMGERTVTPAVDVWGMGMVWVRTLAGRLPIAEDADLPACFASILTGPPLSVRAVEPSVPSGIAAAIDRAIERPTTSRHRGMGAFLDAILDGARSDRLQVRDPRDPPVRGGS